MGRSVKLFSLDNGQKVSINDVMQATGCKDSAARYRLAASRDPDKVLAPKGTHKGFGCGHKNKVKKNLIKTKSNAFNSAVYETFIINNKPFYADPMYRLALQKISCNKAN